MRNNCRRIITFLIVLVMSASVLLPCVTAFAETVNSSKSFASLPNKRNSDTGFYAVIADEADLLTYSQERALLDDMYPLTKYANIAVYTAKTSTTLKDYERAKQKRVELFGTDADAAILLVDMYLRRIVIQRRGNMEQFFDNSRANNITNNISPIAKKGDYYSACATAMQQMFEVVEQRSYNVPQPMKYLSNGVIALMLGCLTSFLVATLTSTSIRKQNDKAISRMNAAAPLIVDIADVMHDGKRSVARSSGSSGGGSSCGGSSCSSSCGGSSCGSSCGGSSF